MTVVTAGKLGSSKSLSLKFSLLADRPMVVSWAVPAVGTLLLLVMLVSYCFKTSKSQLNAVTAVFSLVPPRSTLHPGGSCCFPVWPTSLFFVTVV